EPATGETTVLAEDRSDTWLEIVTGVPAWTDAGELVFVREEEDTRRLTVDGRAVTRPGLQVREVVHVGANIVFAGSDSEPMDVHLWRASASGTPVRLTEEQGVHGGVAGGDVLVVSSSSIDRDDVATVIRRGDREVCRVGSGAARPVLRPDVTLVNAGDKDLRSAVLLPTGARPDDRLPVLVDPYGGPQFQRVVRARQMYLVSQWLADQGFAVVVADGRGTPGRGLEWEKAVRFDLATPALEDQVEALHALAERDRK